MLTLPVVPALAAKPPLELTPSSKWQVNYADDSCRLARQFGTGDEEIIFVLDKMGPSEHFKLTLAGKYFRRFRYDTDIFTMFGPSEQKQKVAFFSGDFGKGLPALIQRSTMRFTPITDAEAKMAEKAKPEDQFELQPIGKDREAAITFMDIGQFKNPSIRLQLGSMEKPLAALSKCTEGLLRNWGVDIVKHATLNKKAVPLKSPANWLVPADYPQKMLQQGQRGVLYVRLSVDETGLPSQCHIQLSTRPQEFEEAVCNGLKRRARFSPALDADGKPIASYWQSGIVFDMPN